MQRKIHKIFYILIILSLTGFAQNKLKPVRHDAITEAWLTKDSEACFKLLQKAYVANPDNFAYAYNLGYISFLNGKMSHALDYFQTARKLNPKSPYSYLMISKIYNQSKNIVSANNVLRLGLEEDPDNYDLLLELARIYYQSGNVNLAIETYSKLIDDFQDEYTPVAELAKIYREQKRYNRAMELLDFDDEDYPESIAVLEKYKTYRDVSDHDKAKTILLDLVSTYPNSKNFQKYIDTLRIKYAVNHIPQPVEIVKYNYALDPREKLNYLVEYGFITLGWMKVRLEKEMEINGKKVYHMVFYIDSNPSFDFIISLHPIYESYIDAETLSAVRSRLYTPDGEENLVRMYYFEYEKNEFKSYCVKNDGRFSLTIKDLPSAAQDGTSMLYLARGLVSNKTSGTTVVVVHEKYKYAIIKYLNETEEVEVAGKDVKSTKIFAQAKFSGVAGMNGDAYGWFSLDEQAVPFEGKIEIIVGSITVRVDDEED